MQALINLAYVFCSAGRGGLKMIWRGKKEKKREAWLALLISQNLSCFGLSCRSKLALKAEKYLLV